jgi:hypothetical protein
MDAESNHETNLPQKALLLKSIVSELADSASGNADMVSDRLSVQWDQNDPNSVFCVTAVTRLGQQLSIDDSGAEFPLRAALRAMGPGPQSPRPMAMPMLTNRTPRSADTEASILLRSIQPTRAALINHVDYIDPHHGGTLLIADKWLTAWSSRR